MSTGVGARVARPRGRELLAGASERPLGLDQSNTSAVVAERLLVKVFRRLEAGLNPDLELAAYLSEEAGFEATPRLAGSIELVTAAAGVETVAVVTEYLADAADAFEDLAERLTAWLLAPGEVAVEFATEPADELGRLVAGLHATLAAAEAPGFELRPATREELRRWHEAALEHLDAAIDALDGVDQAARGELRASAPVIARGFEAIEASVAVPVVMRIHGDLHLGQLLRLPDGYQIIDFEGDPLLPLEQRRALASPLRDVATMLRSLDHVASSARAPGDAASRRPARARGPGPRRLVRPGSGAVPRRLPARPPLRRVADRRRRGAPARLRARQGMPARRSTPRRSCRRG